MMVWAGAGVVVPFFLVMVLLLGNWVGVKIPVINSLPKNVYLGVQLLIVGVLCYLFHLLLKREKPRIVIDKATGKEIALKSKHSLFFIPIFWWSVIISVAGLWTIVENLLVRK